MKRELRTSINRLTKLADHLVKNVRHKAFNMNTWCYYDEESCGTAACALGHAAMIPSFRRAGLKLSESSSREPEHNGVHGYLAGASFFGIDYWQSDWIFNPMWYRANHPTRFEVAKRIRDVIKTLKKRAKEAA